MTFSNSAVVKAQRKNLARGEIALLLEEGKFTCNMLSCHPLSSSVDPHLFPRDERLQQRVVPVEEALQALGRLRGFEAALHLGNARIVRAVAAQRTSCMQTSSTARWPESALGPSGEVARRIASRRRNERACNQKHSLQSS